MTTKPTPATDSRFYVVPKDWHIQEQDSEDARAALMAASMSGLKHIEEIHRRANRHLEWLKGQRS